jgi:hypothetical protein
VSSLFAPLAERVAVPYAMRQGALSSASPYFPGQCPVNVIYCSVTPIAFNNDVHSPPYKIMDKKTKHVDSFRAGAYAPARKLLQTCTTYTIAECTVNKTPDDGQTNCPKHVEFRDKTNL